MNRRDFMKAVGVACLCPGIPIPAKGGVVKSTTPTESIAIDRCSMAWWTTGGPVYVSMVSMWDEVWPKDEA